MIRYQLVAETSDGDTIEVELNAPDAEAAVMQLAELVTRDRPGQPRTLVRVHARPLDG